MNLCKTVVPVVLGLVFLALAQPRLAGAQTEPSLRIRSLAISFGGILDDYLTDVYLNPARVSQLDRSMAYAVTYPGRSVQAAYPIARAFLYNRGWVEMGYLEYTFAPFGLSYFGTVGNGLAFSLGAELDVSGDESLEQASDFYTYRDEIRLSTGSHGRLTDVRHYLLDLALATTDRDNRLGARLTAAYDSGDFVHGDYWQTTEWDLSISDRINRRFDGDYLQNELKKLSLNLELGLFRPGGLVRDVVINAGLTWQELDSDSRDFRGDSWESPDYIVSSSFDETAYLSGREYNGYGAGARAHFGWSERVRSTHAFTWSHSSGDGNGESHYDDENHGSTSSISSLRASYGYDGSTDAFLFESTIGYFNNLFDNVLFAFALFGAYSQSDLDEKAEGEAAFYLYDSSLGLDSTFASPYRQNHRRTLEGVRISVPMAVEWEFHKYAKLRIGVTITASRTEDDRVSDRNAAALNDEFDILGGVFDARELRMNSGVDAVFLNGLEININDRFVVDLYSRYTSSITITEYGYASVRYKF